MNESLLTKKIIEIWKGIVSRMFSMDVQIVTSYSVDSPF